MKYLPSKKFIIAAVSAVLFSVAGWWGFIAPKKSVEIDTTTHLASSNQQKQLADVEKDSDGDGLKDWEELVWGTDPYDASSRPQEQQNETERRLLEQKFPDELDFFKEDNLTKKLSADFGDMYLRRKASGVKTDDISGILFENIKAVITEEAQKKIPDAFSAKDVLVSSSESTAEIRTYVNAIGTILSSPPHISIVSEPELIQQAFIEEDIRVLADLSLHHENYEFFIQELKKLPAPASLAGAHLLFLNSFGRLSIIMQRLALFEEDPVRGFSALAQYSVASEESLEPLGALVDVIKQQRIVFVESESGSLFNTYVELRN